LSGKYYTDYQKGITKDTFNTVIGILEGKAYHEGNCITLYNRVAKVADTIFYDLGDNERVVRIDSNDWEIITDSPIKFRRFSHQLPQVIPVRGGQLSAILKYINITEPKAQLLFLTYIVTAFIPDIPRPILVHTGDQGAAKSTGMRVARSFIDPSKAELLVLPTDILELALAANHHYCLYFDNLSGLPDQYSDAPCRLATGIGFTKRKLYSDNEDILLHQKTAVGINGIPLVASKPDLLDRCVIIRFDRITDDNRIEEAELWSSFNGEKPQILGAIFTALSKTIAIFLNIKLNKKPRMADYSKFAASSCVALGYTAEDFIDAFSEMSSGK
jgi:hypothetical protein